MGESTKCLIRDRDKKYVTHFTSVTGNVKEVETPYRTPQVNEVCERFMGSLRRECMDHDNKHLRQVVTKYTAYFNQERPHPGIDQRIPDHYKLPKPTSGHVASKAILGGLYHSYSRPTQLN